MATVYKKTTFNALQSIPARTPSAEENLKISQTLNNFVSYFKAKHLS